MSASNKFQKIVERCNLINKIETQEIYEFKVSEEDLNFVFSLHGGCISTILESCMKNAVSTLQTNNPNRKPVTVDISISFLSAAAFDDDLLIEIEKIKEGGNLAYIYGKILRKSDKVPIAMGKQTLTFSSDSDAKEFEEYKISSISDSKFLEKFIEFYNSFSTDGVNYIFDRCKANLANVGHIFFEFTVTKDDLDLENQLHNGCLATLLDVLMSLSIFEGNNNSGQLGVTADLNITYFEKAVADEKLLIECKVIKKGSRMAFIHAKAWKIKDNKHKIVAMASQALTVFKGFSSSAKI